MQNQCICLTCYKQHEKPISTGTGTNHVHNQKQYYKSMGSNVFLPPTSTLSAGESVLNMGSMGKRDQKQHPGGLNLH